MEWVEPGRSGPISAGEREPEAEAEEEEEEVEVEVDPPDALTVAGEPEPWPCTLHPPDALTVAAPAAGESRAPVPCTQARSKFGRARGTRGDSAPRTLYPAPCTPRPAPRTWRGRGESSHLPY